MPRYFNNTCVSSGFGYHTKFHVGQDGQIFCPLSGRNRSKVFACATPYQFYNVFPKIKKMLNEILENCEHTPKETLTKMLCSWPPFSVDTLYLTDEQARDVENLESGQVSIAQMRTTEDTHYVEVIARLACGEKEARLENLTSNIPFDVKLMFSSLCVAKNLRYLNDKKGPESMLRTLSAFESVLFYVKAWSSDNDPVRNKTTVKEKLMTMVRNLCPRFNEQAATMAYDAIKCVIGGTHGTNVVNKHLIENMETPKTEVKCLFHLMCVLFRAWSYKYLTPEFLDWEFRDSSGNDMKLKGFYCELLCEALCSLEAELNRVAFIALARYDHTKSFPDKNKRSKSKTATEIPRWMLSCQSSYALPSGNTQNCKAMAKRSLLDL